MASILNKKENRRFPRIKLRIPLHYRLRGTSEFDNVSSEDISLGGLRFTNNRFIPPLSNLSLEINILSRVLSPTGRVVWSTPLPHSDRYNLGVEFLDFHPDEKKYLADYIDIRIPKR